MLGIPLDFAYSTPLGSGAGHGGGGGLVERSDGHVFSDERQALEM